MKAMYEITMKITVCHNVDDLTHLKSDREMGESIGQMICDEAVICNGVASYDIIKSCMTAK